MVRASAGLLLLVLALPAGAPATPQDTPQGTSQDVPSATTQPAPQDTPADAAKPEASPTAAPAPSGKPLTGAQQIAAMEDTRQSICLLVESAARANGLPVEFFARVIWQESRFQADAVGPVTRSGQRAQGIAQFMPGTAAERNLFNPMDPIQALPKSAEFLSELRSQFGNLGLAAAAYNAGPRRVREWLAGTGGMPAETRNYVLRITGHSVEQWAKAAPEESKQGSGRSCGELMALLKQAPNRFIASLEQHIVLGTMKPWGVILGADRSRERMMERYADLQRRHTSALAGRDPILLDRRRGVLPRYQVRIGEETRGAANELCDRIHKSGGDCVVLRNTRG